MGCCACYSCCSLSLFTTVNTKFQGTYASTDINSLLLLNCMSTEQSVVTCCRDHYRCTLSIGQYILCMAYMQAETVCWMAIQSHQVILLYTYFLYVATR